MLKKDLIALDSRRKGSQGYGAMGSSGTSSPSSPASDTDRNASVPTLPDALTLNPTAARPRSDSSTSSVAEVHPLVGEANNGFYCNGCSGESCFPPPPMDPDGSGQQDGKYSSLFHRIINDRRVTSLTLTIFFTATCVYWNSCMQVVAQGRANRLFNHGTVNNSKYKGYGDYYYDP